MAGLEEYGYHDVIEEVEILRRKAWMKVAVPSSIESVSVLNITKSPGRRQRKRYRNR
jgi:hypothetical protein